MVALVAVLVIGVLARLALLRLPMRYDEAYTFAEYAVLPPHLIWSTYTQPNNQILNSLLMHWSWQAFGNHLWSLRLPAFVTGSLTPVFGYLAGRRMYGRGAGLWAAALIATAGPVIEFSVNGRGYAVGGMFVVACLWLAARMVHGRGRWEVLAFGASGALALWSVPTMVYGLGAVGLWAGGEALVAVRPVRPGPLVRVLLGAALAGVLAWLLYRPSFGEPAWSSHGLAPTWENRRLTLAGAWHFWTRTTPFPLPTALALAFVAAIGLEPRLRRSRASLAAAIAVVAVAALFIGPMPPYARSWFALLPLSCVALSGVAAWLTLLAGARLRRPVLVAAGIPVLVAVAMTADLLVTGQQGSEEPPSSDNAIVNVVRDELRDREVLVNPVGFSVGIDWYFQRFRYAGGRPDVTPEMKAAGHVDVIIAGHDGAVAVATVAARGGHPTGAPPTLLRDLPYISVWRVPVLPA